MRIKKKKHPPVITTFTGGIGYSQSWVVYGIVLPTLHMQIPLKSPCLLVVFQLIHEFSWLHPVFNKPAPAPNSICGLFVLQLQILQILVPIKKTQLR